MQEQMCYTSIVLINDIILRTSECECPQCTLGSNYKMYISSSNSHDVLKTGLSLGIRRLSWREKGRDLIQSYI